MSSPSPPMSGNLAAEKAPQQSTAEKKPAWSLRKKLLLVGIVLLVVVGLGVGLGVGLTVGRDSGDDNDNDNDNNNDNGNGNGGNNGGNEGGNDDNKSLWKPKVAARWQISLSKPLNPKKDLIDGVDIYDIDLFDNPESTIKALHEEGKKVICYFSAGSYEDWRDDAKDFDKDDLGKPLDGWKGERWLRLGSDNVRDIMKDRIKYAADKGCDAIDPDNVDGYANENGLGLKESDSISYMKFLSQAAASHDMSTGLKNAGSIIPQVLPHVHFSVNEQCVQYDECETFAAFVKDDKPVFNIEYPEGRKWTAVVSGACSGKGDAEGTKGFSTVVKNMNLDLKVEYCNGKMYDS